MPHADTDIRQQPDPRPLTDEEISYFKANGYLILRGVLDPGLCARARDRVWETLPAHVALRRDDPETHVGPFRDEDRSTDPLHVRDGFLWQVRSVGTERDLIHLMCGPALTEVAESLLGAGRLLERVVGGTPMGASGPAWPGGPVDPSLGTEGVRGIYCTLPYGDVERQPDHGHTDGNPMMLGAVGLIDDVAPDGGAFKVWPGSHRRIYPLMWMQYDQARIPYYPHLPSYSGLIQPSEYHAELARIMADTEPVDCWGAAGDVVLWHHRLVHMAGQNHTDRIRQAVLCDFSTIDLDRNRMDPPQANMWRDWSPRVNSVGDEYSESFAHTQRSVAERR